MPVVFQLTRKGEKEAIVLQKLDEELCKHLDEPCHEKHWVGGWYDYIGFRLALGKTFQEIESSIELDLACQESKEAKEHYERLLKINRYLAENFTPDAWREHKH